MKQNYAIVLSVLLLLNGLLISQANNNSFHNNEVFQTAFLLKIMGELNRTLLL